MKDLLKLEFRRLKSSKSFYVCLAIMVAMLLLTGIMTKLLVSLAPEIVEISEEMGDIPGANTFAVNTTAFILSFLSASNFTMIAAIFVSIAVCDDYGSKIIRNIVARGYTRTEYYFSKFIYVLVAATVMFLICCLTAIAFGGIFFGLEGVTGKVFLLLGGQYVVCMAFVTLCFALASLIKKLGGAIAVNILAPSVFSLILSLADSALQIEEFKVADVWLTSFLTSLTVTNVGTGRIVACVLGAVLYGVVFVLLGYFANRKTEL